MKQYFRTCTFIETMLRKVQKLRIYVCERDSCDACDNLHTRLGDKVGAAGESPRSALPRGFFQLLTTEKYSALQLLPGVGVSDLFQLKITKHRK